MTDKRDYYMVLGVSPISKTEDIKKAYKQKAKEYHPDLNQDKKLYAEEKMKELTEAYEVLMDYDKRSDYDSERQFAVHVPAQLKRSGKQNDMFVQELEKGKGKGGFFEKLKNLFRSNKNTSDNNLMSREMADRFATGVTYYTQNNENMLKMAKVEFEAVLAGLPENPDALYNLGLINYKFGDFAQALIIFKKLLARYPNYPDIKKMTVLLRNDD